MTRRNSNDPGTIASEFKSHIAILGGLVGVMWLIRVADGILPGTANIYGIIPRTSIGVRGILFSPFLHGSYQHLISNTIPFIMLGWFVMLRSVREFFAVSAIVLLASGIGVWLFGSPGIHVGASGVVFGYFGFLLSRAYFERSALSIALSLAVGLIYGSLIWGVLPTQLGISWEGHLFGFVGGVFAAKWLSAK
ncbi:rhomboid family intramembrane serine protease [Myxacorys almedinensis]|uniref:Rhomboid family intramembrane serine protease n=1 Tax=Myxacorys almedinensis A TaxID=2690445 RepID=A0A8J8CJZ3_9CYAN|nr:rhomboid family intramembrane serine protease [Myxacorys almedinensis]NDJ18066.1 rhomboid family intramembrane serine protease [Myxacorys almedinensis A]